MSVGRRDFLFFPMFRKLTNFVSGGLPDYYATHKVLLQWYRHTKEKCHFSIMNSVKEFSHNKYTAIKALDKPMVDHLKVAGLGQCCKIRQLKYRLRVDAAGDFNNSILIIYGDHGHRLSYAKFTYYGQIEERGAFFAFLLPKW